MKIRSFEAFWPYYLGQHREPGTRVLHFIGTGLGILSLLTALFTLNIYYVVIAPIVGYGLAWYSHAFIEKNRPATFSHPLWSVQGDFRLFLLMLTRGFDTRETLMPKILPRQRR